MIEVKDIPEEILEKLVREADEREIEVGELIVMMLVDKFDGNPESALYDYVQEFIEEHKLHCVDEIYDENNVTENDLEAFCCDCCDIVGYKNGEYIDE